MSPQLYHQELPFLRLGMALGRSNVHKARMLSVLSVPGAFRHHRLGGRIRAIIIYCTYGECLVLLFFATRRVSDAMHVWAKLL